MFVILLVAGTQAEHHVDGPGPHTHTHTSTSLTLLLGHDVGMSMLGTVDGLNPAAKCATRVTGT